MQQEEIAAYLNGNAALREAVGIAQGVELEPRPLGKGEHNLNYRFDDPRVGRAFVLRVNVVVQPFHDDQVGYEFAALEALAPCGRVPKPLYLDNSASALGKGVLVMEFREGRELDFDDLRPGDLRCAAQIMADIHAVPVHVAPSLHRPADPLRELFDECVRRFELYRASAFEDARITRWARRFIAAGEKAVLSNVALDCTHVINTETLPSHFLIPEASARAAATNKQATGRFCDDPGSFVDWERPIVGEVAQDVAFFVSPATTFWDSDFLFPKRDVEAFVEDYWRAVDGRFERGNFDERFKAYLVMAALRAVTWCCRGLIAYSAGSGAHTTEKTASKLPVYLSDDFLEMLADACL